MVLFMWFLSYSDFVTCDTQWIKYDVTSLCVSCMIGWIIQKKIIKYVNCMWALCSETSNVGSKTKRRTRFKAHLNSCWIAYVKCLNASMQSGNDIVLKLMKHRTKSLMSRKCRKIQTCGVRCIESMSVSVCVLKREKKVPGQRNSLTVLCFRVNVACMTE